VATVESFLRRFTEIGDDEAQVGPKLDFPLKVLSFSEPQQLDTQMGTSATGGKGTWKGQRRLSGVASPALLNDCRRSSKGATYAGGGRTPLL